MPVSANMLPPPPPALIGREADLDAVLGLLGQPGCRLLTIAGPGGIGKTRLAEEVAARSRPAYRDGVAFVALQQVADPSLLAPTIAAALACPPASHGDVTGLLLSYLRDRELLLVLDNVEHLLGGVGLLSEIVASAPKVRVLVTSREALNLREEWRYSLDGLPVPGGASDVADGAVQLFAARARQVRPDFDLGAERDEVVRICRLVDGMPLAIELAAAWTRTLPAAAIADEIARNLAFLETHLRDVPDRHRSVRAAFDQSWALLSEVERLVFARLAVFRGGFSYEAAAALAEGSGARDGSRGAESRADGHVQTFGVLQALVDKSLLRCDSGTRCQLHELLRQYAEERLRETPSELALALDRHADFYTEFLAARSAAMEGGRQREAAAEIAAEIENVRGAWLHAVERADAPALERCFSALPLFFQHRGRYREGADLLAAAVRRLEREELTEPVGRALALILNEQAWFHIRFGQLAAARSHLERAQAIYERFGLAPLPGMATDPMIGLADAALIEGEYAAAARYGELALRNSQAHQHLGNLPCALYVLANVALAQGSYQTARRYAQRAYTAALKTQDQWFMAYCLIDLGSAARAQGQYAEARRYYQEAYELREAFGDPEGMALALLLQGRCALDEGHAAEAHELFSRCAATYREIGDRGGAARTHCGLGEALAALDRPAEAAAAFAEALRIAAEIPYVPLLLQVLVGVGQLLPRLGLSDLGPELLLPVLRHPASDRETGERAQRVLASYESSLGPERFQSALDRGRQARLDEAVARLQLELLVPRTQETQVSRPALPSQPLVEALTEREHEVLRLIAAGCSNQEIADALILAIGTVKWYATQIYGKLSVQTRTQAIARARALSLIG